MATKLMTLKPHLHLKNEFGENETGLYTRQACDFDDLIKRLNKLESKGWFEIGKDGTDVTLTRDEWREKAGLN